MNKNIMVTLLAVFIVIGFAFRNSFFSSQEQLLKNKITQVLTLATTETPLTPLELASRLNELRQRIAPTITIEFEDQHGIQHIKGFDSIKTSALLASRIVASSHFDVNFHQIKVANAIANMDITISATGTTQKSKEKYSFIVDVSLEMHLDDKDWIISYTHASLNDEQ